jgi:hypothetical protein
MLGLARSRPIPTLLSSPTLLLEPPAPATPLSRSHAAQPPGPVSHPSWSCPRLATAPARPASRPAPPLRLSAPLGSTGSQSLQAPQRRHASDPTQGTPRDPAPASCAQARPAPSRLAPPRPPQPAPAATRSGRPGRSGPWRQRRPASRGRCRGPGCGTGRREPRPFPRRRCCFSCTPVHGTAPRVRVPPRKPRRDPRA